jgi:hypothetical protein
MGGNRPSGNYNAMKIDLQKIETTLKDFFETDLQIVSHKNPLQNITNEMVSLMEKNLKRSGDKVFAPNIFRVYIRDKELIQENEIEEWKKYVREIIRDISHDNSFQLSGPLHIEVFHNPKLDREFEISVSNSSLPTGETVDLITAETNDKKEEPALNGYLITADENYYNLTKSITSIGRREDNDLVIDNLRVSRVHAQIRLLNTSTSCSIWIQLPVRSKRR